MSRSSPYDVLGVSEEAPEAVVDAAYRVLVKETHPDHGGEAAEFSEIKNAYEKIKSGDTSPEGQQTNKSSGIFGDLFSETPPAETISAVGDPSSGLTVEGNVFTVRLISVLPLTDVESIVKLSRRLGENTRRTLVLFDIENNTEDVHRWHRDQTRYIDTDGFTYEAERAVVDSDSLGPRWTSYSVELDGKSRTYFVAMVEELPSDSRIARIVHTQKTHVEGKTAGWVQSQERYEFVIDELDDDLVALPQK